MDYTYFVPGYTGFCPELREHFGQTYGHATRRIIYEKPHLKERLAPVFYNYRRPGANRMEYDKRYDNVKENRQGANRMEYDKRYDNVKENRPGAKRMEYDKRCDHVNESRPGAKRMEYGKQCDHVKEKHDHSRKKRQPNYLDSNKERVRMEYNDGDRYRETDHECTCPRLIYAEGVVECPPELWTMQEAGDSYYAHQSFMPMPPCPHLMPRYRDYAEVQPRARKASSNCNQNRRVPRVKPHREGGVIPKYTGFIPGIQFSFGESYGPVSDRLLRRHHDRMKQMNRRP